MVASVAKLEPGVAGKDIKEVGGTGTGKVCWARGASEFYGRGSIGEPCTAGKLAKLKIVLWAGLVKAGSIMS